MKYKTVKISGIVTQIAEATDTPGYTKGVIESMLPGDDEMIGWSKKQVQIWISKNNKRMKAICKLLNENKL